MKRLNNLLNTHDIYYVLLVVFVWFSLISINLWWAMLRVHLEQFDWNYYNFFVKIWANWDGGHYLSIVKNGYGKESYAFFPLLPLLIKFTSFISTLSIHASGVILSRIFVILGAFYFFKLALLDHSREVSLRALFYYLMFPTAFFLLAIYSEGLFLFTASASFYFAYRKHWLKAGIFGLLCSLTRFSGIFLYPSLIIEWNREKHDRNKVDLLILLLSPLGLVLYSIYNWFKTDNLFSYWYVQETWGRMFNLNPLPMLITYLQKATQFTDPASYIIDFMDLSFFLLGVLILIMSFNKIRLSMWVFCLLIVITPVFTGTLMSYPRFILQAFPLFMVLAQFGRREIVNFSIITIFLLIQSQLLLSFAYFWWVA